MFTGGVGPGFRAVPRGNPPDTALRGPGGGEILTVRRGVKVLGRQGGANTGGKALALAVRPRPYIPGVQAKGRIDYFGLFLVFDQIKVAAGEVTPSL